MSLLLALFAVAPTVRDCGVQTLFKIDSVGLSPTTPLPGDNVTLQLTYTVPLGYIATDGKAKYELTYNFLPLSPTIQPLCDNIPCPLLPGTYSNNTYELWPEGLAGTLKTKITWTDVSGELLLCMTINAKF